MPKSRLASEPLVLIDGSPRPDLRALRIEQWSGRKANRAELAYHPGLSGDRLLDRELVTEFPGKWCEVIVPGAQPIHFGQIVAIAPVLSETYAYTLTSRLEPYHFGAPLVGMATSARLAGDGRRLHWILQEDPVFNPLVDGRITGNMQVKDGRYSFLDVRCTRSQAARDYQAALQEPIDADAGLDPTNSLNDEQPDHAQGGLHWTLATAVYHLCWELNAFQEAVANPRDIQALERQLAVRDADTHSPYLKDVRLQRRLYLPDALDALLAPFGFTWHVEHAVGVRTLAFVRRGKGPLVTVQLQRPGEVVDQSKSNAKGCSLALDVGGRLINSLRLHGGYYTIETTVELLPGWTIDDEPEDLDADGMTDLTLGSEAMAAAPRLRDVCRLFVAGEGGDLVGHRIRDAQNGGQEITIDAPLDLNALLREGSGSLSGGLQEPIDAPDPGEGGNVQQQDPIQQNLFIVRRRPLLPCITMLETGEPAGEYQGMRFEFSTDGGTTWQNVVANEDSIGLAEPFEILPDQMGIRFSGETPPETVLGFRDSFRLRVTAAIEADVRLMGIAQTLRSPNAHIVHQELDMPTRFLFRRVLSSSEFYTDLQNNRLLSGEINHQAAIEAFADQLLVAWNQADVSGPIPLEGLDWPAYALGQRVAKIAGRDLGLSADADGTAHPQIVGISWDTEFQTTFLHLNAVRDEPIDA